VRYLPRPVANSTTNGTSNVTSDGSGIISDDFNSSNKVSWDGEVIPDGPWLDRKLFKIGDYDVTN